MLGALLVGILLLVALTPTQFTRTPGARAASMAETGQQSSGEKRVYTNDDFPASKGESTEEEMGEDEGAQPVPGPQGERAAPFVPTPMEIVDRMLDIAGTKPNDVVYDLGSGDGRIVLRAAERFGSRAVGVELEHRLAVESAAKAKEMGLDKLVTIIEGDLFQTDLSPASVVTVYLLLSTNDRLRPILEKQLRPGTRVVAHDIRIPGWKAAREEEVKIGLGIHYIYLYEIPGAFRE
jgi:protein-L-isoaspartate O-methyltransferase